MLEHPGIIKDPSKVRESWQATFGGRGNANKIAVLEEGMKYTLDPWVSRWEQAMVRALLTPDEKKEYFFKFNPGPLQQGVHNCGKFPVLGGNQGSAGRASVRA